MREIFKGYVPVRNKKCTMPFRGKSADELLTLAEASTHEEFAGILNDTAVLVDFDDGEQAAKALAIVEEQGVKCRVHETTRGLHFFFAAPPVGRLSRNKTGARLAVGLTADIKLGSRNSYAVVRKDGEDRECVYDVVNESGVYDVLPPWLLPVNSKNTDFLHLGEGDGRNQALFNYILSLQGAGFAKDEARETLRLMNAHVLAKPLAEKELETLMRDEAFTAPAFYDGKTFLHNAFAKFLIAEHHIKRIDGQLYSYTGQIYERGNLEGLMLTHLDTLKQAQRKEVEAYIDVTLGRDCQQSPANLVAFTNGVLDVHTGKVAKFSPDYVLTNQIPWAYNPDAYNAETDRVLNDIACGDKGVRALLEEVLGYALYRRSELRKAFVLYSAQPGSGKSTYIAMMRALLGERNTVALDLSDLSHEFKAAELAGKLANLGDDINDEYISNPAVFKKIVSGDTVNVNKKYAQPFDFRPYCKLIFSANTIPRLGRGRDSSAIVDRLVIVPFNASFRNSESFDPFIKYRLIERASVEYLARLAVEGLRRVLVSNGFTETAGSREALADYAQALNPISRFFEDLGLEGFVNRSTKDCYNAYRQFCFDEGVQALGHIAFSKEVSSWFGLRSRVARVDGEVVRVFDV